MGPPPKNINLISCGTMSHVSDIKLIRTDTTLDLSQKAEKGMLCVVVSTPFYAMSFYSHISYLVDMGQRFPLSHLHLPCFFLCFSIESLNFEFRLPNSVILNIT